ncbi:MAG: DUF4279 domain-containing protein [Leptonema sp. (in: Bacteria)]|nr:DUF4279 domain-containing protein [Leptonema sp. (in: bacteria)]
MSEASGWAIFLIQGRNLSVDWLETNLRMKADSLKEARDGMRHWQLNSRLAGYQSIEAHIDDLLRRLMPVRKSIKNLPSGLSSRFICSMLTRSINRATLVLPSNQLLLIGALGCNLEVHFDLINDSKEDKQDTSASQP